MHILDQIAEDLTNTSKAIFTSNPISDHYYEISESSDRKEIGRMYPQVNGINLHLAHQIGYHSIPEVEIEFKKVELYNSAKLTDVISTGAISAHGLFLSKRAYTIFRNFDLGNHKHFKAKLIHKEKKHQYGYLQIINDQTDNINFEESKFYIEDILGLPVHEIEINSREEFGLMQSNVYKGNIKNIEKYSNLRTKLIQLKDPNLLPAFFTFKTSGVTQFISKTLGDKLIESKITGTAIIATKRIKNP